MNIPLPFSKWLTSLLPPPRLAPVPLLVEVIVCLLVLFACFFCLSICQYIFPWFCPCLLQKCTHYCIQHQFSFKFAVESAQPRKQKKKKEKVWPPKNRHSQWECWPDRQTCYGLLVFSLSKALPSLSEWPLLAYIVYAHVANATLCFGPCVPPVHTFRVLLKGWKIRSVLKLTYRL